MTAAERVVVISSLSTFDPEHINRRNNTEVGRLLEGKTLRQLKSTTSCGVKIQQILQENVFRIKSK